MKILGIGVDLIKNERIKISIKNKNFIKRIFSKREILLSNKIKDKTNYFSKRFAAKEALSKSLGIGFRKDLNFKDIEIVNDKYGKPFYFKSKKLNNIIFKVYKTRNYNLFLSISDEKDYSIAFTIIQKK